MPDEQIRKLRLGGHDPRKVYAAYKAATEHKGAPTVILARTIKGYGLGEAGEGRNITHQQKKLNEDELRQFRTRFEIPVNDDQIAETRSTVRRTIARKFNICSERRHALGGYVPQRRVRSKPMSPTTTSYSPNSLRAARAEKFRPRWRSCRCCEKCCAIPKSAS